MERIDKSPMQKNFNNFWRKSTLKEVGHNFPLLKCSLHMVTSFQRVYYGNERKSNFMVEKSKKHYLSQMIKVNITVISDVESTHSGYVMKMTVPFCHLLQKKFKPSLTIHETSDKFK